MDELVKLALVGTAKVSASSDGRYPTDALVAKVEGLPEHQFLLRASAAAIYHLAGQTAEAVAMPEAAAPELAPVCSPRLASLIDRMLAGENRDLLPEALEQLAKTGHILPPEMLPRALEVKEPAIRALLRPAVGHRGRWLGRFNATWAWATEASLNDDSSMPDDAEQIWQEGTLQVRCDLLRCMRTAYPARARGWLEEVWKREKAVHRVKLLQTLEVDLSLDDEAFLARIIHAPLAKR